MVEFSSVFKIPCVAPPGIAAGDCNSAAFGIAGSAEPGKVSDDAIFGGSVAGLEKPCVAPAAPVVDPSIGGDIGGAPKSLVNSPAAGPGVESDLKSFAKESSAEGCSLLPCWSDWTLTGLELKSSAIGYFASLHPPAIVINSAAKPSVFREAELRLIGRSPYPVWMCVA